MKKILSIILLFISIGASSQTLPQKVLAEASKRYPVNDSTTLPTDSFLVTSRAINSDINNVYNSRGKFLNLYRKLLNGSAVSGTTATRGDVHVRQGIFGDSVGGYLATPISNKGVAMFGFGGGVLSSVALTGGGSTHQNTSETTYWFNGTWYEITGAGTLTFTSGGGRISATQLKIYYIKESGAGTFQVSIDAGAGYVNEGSVVDANDATTQSGIITINKTQGTYSVRITRVTGNLKIIMVVGFNEPTGFDSWCPIPLNVGGLNWEFANLTSRAITSPVFIDLGLDLASIEFKENVAAVQVDFKSWLDDFRTASKNTDWVLIGSAPIASQNDVNVAANAALKKIAIEDTLFYYDGYTPLISYARIDSLGWEGDGIHTDAATGFYNAWQLWNIIGVEDVLMFGGYFGTSKVGDIRLNGSRGTVYEGGTNDGLYNGKISASAVGPDLNVQLRRSFSLNNTANTQLAYFEANSGFVIAANPTTRGYVWPSTLIPGVSLSGLYKINDSTYGTFTNKGAGRAANWAARSLSGDSLAIGVGVGLSPSPSSIAEIASTTKGLLIPRMSAAQRLAISSPANYLLVMDTDSARLMQHVSGVWSGYLKTNELPSNIPTSIIGTTNQVIASSPTGAVTLSLPQNIHTGATPQFAGMGLGVAAGTPKLLIAGGNSASAPLKLTSGTNLSSGENGAFEYDGNFLYFTPNTTARGKLMPVRSVSNSTASTSVTPYFKYWSQTGNTASTWTMFAANSTNIDIEITIVNQMSSSSITLNSSGGGNDFWQNGVLSNTLTISAGDVLKMFCDGSKFVITN